MGTIRISYRHNLIKLVLFQALALQPGWYDVHQLCALTGLRWVTISSHVGFWSVGLKNKHGVPIGLLKRRPAHRGYRLIWEYDLGTAGRSWLSNVDPELLHDVSIQLAARWHAGVNSYDIPGDEPLEKLTSLLKVNKPLDVIVLNRSDKVYLKCEKGNIICFSSSSYVGHSVQMIPENAKWSNDVRVVFNALVGLLGVENVPLEPVFVGAGLQHFEDEPAQPEVNIPTPITNEETVINERPSKPRPDDEAYRAWARNQRHY